jgi:hypothetical protein
MIKDTIRALIIMADLITEDLMAEEDGKRGATALLSSKCGV